MSRHNQTLKPLLRIVAAVALLCWLASLVVCSMECCHGDSDHDAGQKEVASTHTDNDSAPDSDHHDDSVCNSLKTFAPVTHENVLGKSDFGFLTLSFVRLPQMLTVAEVEALISRQPPDCQFVFTPEVYLGPALHSLAPPVLA